MRRLAILITTGARLATFSLILTLAFTIRHCFFNGFLIDSEPDQHPSGTCTRSGWNRKTTAGHTPTVHIPKDVGNYPVLLLIGCFRNQQQWMYTKEHTSWLLYSWLFRGKVKAFNTLSFKFNACTATAEVQKSLLVLRIIPSQS